MNRDLLLNLRLDAMKAIDISNADDSAFKELSRVLIPDSEKDDNKVFGPFMEKFAELIVRECIGCCEQVISDPVPKSIDTFEQGGIHCMDEIKEHFGVEE